MSKINWNLKSTNLLRLGVLVLGAFIVLLPLLVVFITSFAPPGAILEVSLKTKWSLANYRDAWERGKFLLAFANSTLVAIAVTAFQMVTSALAGYALARFQFRGKQALLLVVLATLVIPFQLLVIPIFLVLKWGHLINTYGALILPTAVNGFGIFLLRQYFQTIPVELEEAATIDGANRLQILWRVMLPLARPALVTLFLFTFIGEWNDLFKPLVFTTRPELRTVQLALAEFQEQFTNNWPLMMAAVTIATVPVMVLFLIGQRQFIRGIAATGIKN
ncbi:carbohydrate ABC transporter permease [Nodularia spumigena CS-584]|jgi:multiple sugar transport system permease protein|uniref:L-arabinose transport system permease protein AraQ n=2 Tax=Nodularia spumigena TaxID=70799 RepID=A0A2S0Q5Q4_NODSP|nr:carbohydrate ABC transporter permease [Nodularia spumigena]AHJ27072.1 ABC transporter sugar permease [Nodularia spumigena CCY9414]AVZ29662.1 L-arabinose transport system permease protein AraQ [Nodularia spumigena UHCC 0039]EAW47359.1 ABC transporter sugar permease [Nodularia spumigena CCY9414]MDB9383508.1 carbohydrate ABC transporter permease [Nodularia spumigena CS-584]MEA5523661.1 carbohydrate ABC transporter permease [Nodularia spumigena UHCC 0143]